MWKQIQHETLNSTKVIVYTLGRSYRKALCGMILTLISNDLTLIDLFGKLRELAMPLVQYNAGVSTTHGSLHALWSTNIFIPKR